MHVHIRELDVLKLHSYRIAISCGLLPAKPDEKILAHEKKKAHLTVVHLTTSNISKQETE